MALIDAGALLAGVSLRGAAQHALQLMRSPQPGGDGDGVSRPTALQAVVYYDGKANAGAGEWVLLSADGGSWPLSSPIRERNVFVIFDEARCRGADMKLRRDAKAVLTLGPRMAKDKLMQARLSAPLQAATVRAARACRSTLIAAPHSVRSPLVAHLAPAESAAALASDAAPAPRPATSHKGRDLE